MTELEFIDVFNYGALSASIGALGQITEFQDKEIELLLMDARKNLRKAYDIYSSKVNKTVINDD